ncbi:hypothetical protein EJB05_41049, partial [Eragrostis curvula]
MVRYIADRLPDPVDFISFRAVCPQWWNAVLDVDGRFHPWILKSDESGVDGNVVFYCLGSEKFIWIHVPALEGRRLAGFGAGHLIAIDDEERSGVLVNPLLSTAAGGTTTLPRLPEWCVGGDTYGFATDPKMTGDKDVFVVIYKYLMTSTRTYHVAMWRRGSDAGWATISSERFWTRMPMLRRRLGAMGLELLEDDDAGNGGVPWVPGGVDTHVLEHEGRVRFLSRRLEETRWGSFPWPRVSFVLEEIMAAAHVDVDWAEAPELRDKIILHTWNNPCYVLPVPAGEVIGLLKNGVYFFNYEGCCRAPTAFADLTGWSASSPLSSGCPATGTGHKGDGSCQP